MKVGGTSRAGTSALRSTGKSSAPSGQSFQVKSSEAAAGARPVAPVSALTAVDTLLALQEVEDPLARRQQAVKRAHDILDLLDSIRLGLITGGIPQRQLSALVAMVENRRDTFVDPQLSGLVDEIELRAKVEIAKLEQASEPAVTR